LQIRQRLGQGEGTFARRIHQPLVGRPEGHQIVRRDLEQVAGLEARLVRQAVALGVLPRTLNQGLAALHPST
jgi:hypothetical protein